LRDFAVIVHHAAAQGQNPDSISVSLQIHSRDIGREAAVRNLDKPKSLWNIAPPYPGTSEAGSHLCALRVCKISPGLMA
jgi:hypothetical protein